MLGGVERGLSYPDLRPAAWVALLFAAGLGSLLPDIDQPGSLLTRLPANQAHALQRAGARYGRGAIGAPTRASLGVIGTGGEMASAMLGGGAAPYNRPFRLLLLVAACLAAVMFGVVRWLPPPRLLDLSVQERHFAALTLACIAVGCGLMAVGGVATLVNHLPGHHRGWTHAPPVAGGDRHSRRPARPILVPRSARSRRRLWPRVYLASCCRCDDHPRHSTAVARPAAAKSSSIAAAPARAHGQRRRGDLQPLLADCAAGGDSGHRGVAYRRADGITRA